MVEGWRKQTVEFFSPLHWPVVLYWKIQFIIPGAEYSLFLVEAAAFSQELESLLSFMIA